MKTIAEHMVDVMAEQNRSSIWFGDLDLIHECANRSGMYRRIRSKNGDHPLIIIQKVLKALERSEDFDKGYMRYDGNKPACRYFKLNHR